MVAVIILVQYSACDNSRSGGCDDGSGSGCGCGNGCGCCSECGGGGAAAAAAAAADAAAAAAGDVLVHLCLLAENHCSCQWQEPQVVIAVYNVRTFFRWKVESQPNSN